MLALVGPFHLPHQPLTIDRSCLRSFSFHFISFDDPFCSSEIPIYVSVLFDSFVSQRVALAMIMIAQSIELEESTWPLQDFVRGRRFHTHYADSKNIGKGKCKLVGRKGRKKVDTVDKLKSRPFNHCPIMPFHFASIVFFCSVISKSKKVEMITYTLGNCVIKANPGA